MVGTIECSVTLGGIVCSILIPRTRHSALCIAILSQT